MIFHHSKCTWKKMYDMLNGPLLSIIQFIRRQLDILEYCLHQSELFTYSEINPRENFIYTCVFVLCKPYIYVAMTYIRGKLFPFTNCQTNRIKNSCINQMRIYFLIIRILQVCCTKPFKNEMFHNFSYLYFTSQCINT